MESEILEIAKAAHTEVDVVVEQITPAVAHEYLKTNHDNRKESKRHVEWLASQMTANKWMLTHQGIAFDDKGHLRDGQHRLHAIIHSMKTQDMIVVRGLDSNTFTVMDTGKNRGAADVLFIEGFKEYPRELAIVARSVLEWQHGAFRSLGKINKVTNFMILHWVQSNPEVQEYVAKFCQLASVNTGIMQGSMSATFAWLFAHVKSCDKLTACTFMEKLYTGANLGEHSPELYLRNFFLKEKQQINKVPKTVKIALLIKGWNMFRNSTPVPRMWQWNPKAEVFPLPK